MTIRAGPAGRVREPCTPITRAGRAGRIRAGPPPRRRCARTTTRAGPQARSHSGTRARSLAGWIVSEANAHAAEIRHEARDEAAASLADAKKEAADLLRQASDQAAAKLAAVESEAAQVQAALMKLSTELGEAAATTLHPAAD